MAYKVKNHGYSSWYQHCNCCPYGYHIDLDFVRYCESIGQQVDCTGSIKRRRDRRRQRQSMEVLLGLEPPAPFNMNPLNQKAIEEEPTEMSYKQININPSPLLQDSLEEAVSDFERTLQRSNKLSHNLPDVTAVYESFRRVPSVSSMSSASGSSMTVLPSTTDGAVRDYDVMSVESCSLGPAALHHIREQMALSLERTKELEERVKIIPSLQEQLSLLKEEKRQLMFQVNALENAECNENYLNNVSTAPYSRSRSRSLTNTGSFECIYSKCSSIATSRRNVGVTCSVLTRNVGVGHHYPNTKSVATSTWNGEPQYEYGDKWYNEKIKFLTGSTQPLPFPVSYINEIKKPGVIVVTKETQTHLPKEVKSTCSQTLEKSLVQNRNDSFTQTVEIQKVAYNIGITAVVPTTDVACEAIVRTNDLGTSNDTLSDIVCSKCTLNENNSHFYEKKVLNDKNSSISLASLTVSRSKSFNLGDDKLSLRNKTVGCQYESFNLHKACQYELKMQSKACQNEYKTTHKGVQHKYLSLSKNTDTKDLDLDKKHVGCNTSSLKIETSEVACNTCHTFEKTTPCLKCSKKDKDDSRKEDGVMPSRIPRLQVPTTPVENRKFRRQDTYTKIPAATNEKLSGLDLNIKHDNESPNAFEKVKQSYKLPEVSTSQNGVNSSFKTEQESTLPVPETDLCHPIAQTHRKKVKPSKEMQAAIKVLNDSLQKGQAKNLKNQLKNAINIIQEEWFKISSLVIANPLDVEDYLDCFEDISFDLLRYIVNMVDVSGNTAMHYAVSHGNFDVVSILLDSKVCDIDQPNKAGYTSVMLVSLAEVCSATHANVVRRLFQLADVNIRAKQHGQTALMLAVSHGRLDMVQMLLEAGADINIQDEDGSTALMCASEHGHVDIVKHFLSQSDCDSTVTDVDGSTALKIAMEAGHRHIGVLLYAHERNLHGAPHGSKIKKNKSASASPKTPSSPIPLRSSRRALTDSKTNK